LRCSIRLWGGTVGDNQFTAEAFRMGAGARAGINGRIGRGANPGGGGGGGAPGKGAICGSVSFFSGLLVEKQRPNPPKQPGQPPFA